MNQTKSVFTFYTNDMHWAATELPAVQHYICFFVMRLPGFVTWLISRPQQSRPLSFPMALLSPCFITWGIEPIMVWAILCLQACNLSQLQTQHICFYMVGHILCNTVVTANGLYQMFLWFNFVGCNVSILQYFVKYALLSWVLTILICGR